MLLRGPMSNTMTSVAVSAPRRRSATSVWAFVRRNVLTVYSILFFAYLLLPIAVVIAFSFNKPSGRFNYTWQRFTWDNWLNWDAVPGIRSALVSPGTPFHWLQFLKVKPCHV